MGLSEGDAFPVSGLGPGSIHIRNSDGLILLHLGGNPTLESSWRAIGGVTDGDPDTSNWGTVQEGATWYDSSLGVQRYWDGSAIVSGVGAASSWVTYTPSGTWTTNTTYSGRFRKIGDTLEIQVRVDLTGAPDSDNLDIDLPAGFSRDTSKIVNAAQGIDSQAFLFDNTVSGVIPTTLGHCTIPFASRFRVIAEGVSGAFISSATVTQAVPFTWASADKLHLYVKVPVL